MENNTKGNTEQTSLADLLSAVLRHPDLPTEIYNDITDSLCGLSDDAIDLTAPEFIARVLSQPRGDDAPQTEPPPVDAGQPNADLVFKAVTYEDARRIVNRDSIQSKERSDEEIGDLLALMFCLTYCEQVQRDGVLYEVVNAFMPRLNCAHKSTERMVVARYIEGWQ